MLIELFYESEPEPFDRYESDVVPRIGDLIAIVDANRELTMGEVVRVMHRLTTKPDTPLVL